MKLNKIRNVSNPLDRPARAAVMDSVVAAMAGSDMRSHCDTIQSPQDLPSTDEEIRLAATDAIISITTFPMDTLKMDVRDGWIVLAGTADNSRQRDMVENLVRQVNGVKGVINLIRIVIRSFQPVA